MDDPLSSQRLEDVITFLELIESKMGKNNIDGLVEKLKMKHPKFIATLKTKIIEQFAARVYSNWPIKKKLNLLFILNKYLQDPVKRHESREWTEVFDHLLASIFPEVNDGRDASHVTKLFKHWTKDDCFPSESLCRWQNLHSRYLQPVLDAFSKAKDPNEKFSIQYAADDQKTTFHSPESILPTKSERRRRSLSFIEQQIRGHQSQTRDRVIFAMRKFLYDAYSHFIGAAVSLNDALHWRVVITSSFWLLNQYILHEFCDIDESSVSTSHSKLDDPLAVCLACIYVSGKAEQYFIRSEKLRYVAQKCMHAHFAGIQNPLNVPGDASLFQMELKLLRMINYNIGEIVNPCRTLRDWLLHKRINQDIFQKTTATIVKPDFLLGRFYFGMDSFDHDNILAFFLLLAQAVFPQSDMNNATPSDEQAESQDDTEKYLCLQNSLESTFKNSTVFSELRWNETLKDMVLSIQSNPLKDIDESHSLQFVRVFVQLWDVYYPFRQMGPELLMKHQETVSTIDQITAIPQSAHAVIPSTPTCATNSNTSSTPSTSHSMGKEITKSKLPSDSNSSKDANSRETAHVPLVSGQKRPRSNSPYQNKGDWDRESRHDSQYYNDYRSEESSYYRTTGWHQERGHYQQYRQHHRERSYHHNSHETSSRHQYDRMSYLTSSREVTPAKYDDRPTVKNIENDKNLSPYSKKHDDERQQMVHNHHLHYRCNSGVAVCLDVTETEETVEREDGECVSDNEPMGESHRNQQYDSNADGDNAVHKPSPTTNTQSDPIDSATPVHIHSKTIYTRVTTGQDSTEISKENMEFPVESGLSNTDLLVPLKSDLLSNGNRSPTTDPVMPMPSSVCRESSTSSATSFQRRSLWGIAISGVKTQASATVTAVSHVPPKSAKRNREEMSDGDVFADKERKIPRITSLVVEQIPALNHDALLPETSGINKQASITSATHNHSSDHHHHHHRYHHSNHRHSSSHNRHDHDQRNQRWQRHNQFHSKR